MKILRLLPLLFVWALPLTATAQNFQQGFESYPALFTGANPWALVNNSNSAVGGTTWFNGDSTFFTAQSGTGYVAANFFSTGGLTGTETVSNWLLTPTLNLTNGATMTFYTRSTGGAPDHMEVRMSLNASSMNVGATATSVGDFSNILLDINPLLIAGGLPSGYPTTWTAYTAIITGAPVGGTTGRLAFRYTLPNSGLNGVNGDYIGVDSLTSTLTVVPEPSTWVLGLAGLGVVGFVVRRRRAARA